jgi:hypothetical protein
VAAKIGVSVAEAQENATKHKTVKTVTAHGVAATESTANAVDNSTYV